MDPETTYRTFISHTHRCRQCRTAGGEWANDDALCPTGRALARQWGRAETNAARAIHQQEFLTRDGQHDRRLEVRA